MADLVPVEGNPFAPQLVPVEGNPFEETKAPRSYSIGEVPAHAASNFLTSLGGQLKQMYEGAKGVVTHPLDTAVNLGKLATSVNPIYQGVTGLAELAAKALPEEHQLLLQGVLHDIGQPRSALIDDLSKAYGGAEEIKRTLAEDPARFLMDAATIATGGELALAKLPGVAGKVGKVSGVAATALDPISLAAKATTAVAEPATRAILGTRTGAGGAALADAAATGFKGGDDGLNFRRAIKEGVPIEEVVDSARQGVSKLKSEQQRLYDIRKNDPKYGWANDPSTLNFAPITKSWQGLVDSLTTKSGKRKVGDAEWNQIQKVGEVVAEWEKNPALRTVDDFDGLKQRIRSIYPDGEAPQLRRAVTRMANAVGEQIKKQAPGYSRAMRDYSVAADNLWEIEKAFSLGDKSSMQTAMSKLQSVMRNNASTQYGLRGQKLAEIEEAGGKNLRPYLAGSALSSWEPRSLARAGSGAVVPGTLGAIIGGPLGATVGAGLGVVGTSPRAMGELYHGAGRVAGAPDRLAERLLPEAFRPRQGFAYTPFQRPSRLGARALGMEGIAPEPEPEMARGGYFRGRR